ncbi:hypothetical protein JZ751_006137 [Albula glossodonta]|uniref:Uncharacterized protein n=1 Tax=Albula glossodonta TaxID=121402 RepID=A0A8T2ML11_9TELE|nr:hypothetical protein JZ751_016252 [Albula glossodonta]KAG9347209.1 hypothetical protein JZ751_006137 [Albula glossodonta]
MALAGLNPGRASTECLWWKRVSPICASFTSFIPAITYPTCPAYLGHGSNIKRNAQLVHLVGLPQVSRLNPVPLTDLPPKQGDVGHHATVVVKVRVEHQRFEWVIFTGRRPVKEEQDPFCDERAPAPVVLIIFSTYRL